MISDLERLCNTCWPSACHLWKNVSLDPLPFKELLLLDSSYILVINLLSDVGIPHFIVLCCITLTDAVCFFLKLEVCGNPLSSKSITVIFSLCVSVSYFGNSCNILNISTLLFWRRKCQLTPVSLPGDCHGQRSLVDYSPWGCKESDMTEQLTHTHTHTHTHYYFVMVIND